MNTKKILITLSVACSVFCSYAEEYDSEGTQEKRDTIPIIQVPDVPPPTQEVLDQSIRKGVDFLLTHQNKNGSWSDHTNTKGLNVICPFPEGPRSFRLACTSLCVIGLIESPLRNEPAVTQALERAVRYLIKTLPTLKRGDTQTILGVWGHAYGLEALCKAASVFADDATLLEEIKRVAALQVKALDDMTDVRGGWGYYTFDTFSKRPIGLPTAFLTATVLISYDDAAKTFDLHPDPKLLKRSVEFLHKQRTPAGTYVYSNDHMIVPGRLINRHTGSLARTPAGDLALIRHMPGIVSYRQMEDGLERLWSRDGWLKMSIKKPIPHESFAQNSGYFYYYGYYYVARCFELVPQERQKRHAAHLVDDLLPMQEKDGSWWDYPLYNYHKFYGTGYALYAISRAREILYPQATFSTPDPS